MLYQKTTATQKIFNLNKRIRGVSGGTSASKTISILIWLIDYAQSTENETISVVSESMPHLRKGAMRDFLDIMKNHNYFKDDRWDKTNSIYTFEKGSIIEFFGAESWEKVKGARRHVLFINEANHISFETFNQLEVRTKKIIFCDWNPESEFWWYTEVLGKMDCDHITLTYKDNEMLDQQIVDSIESRRGNVNWFKVYGLGQLGDVEARIYKDWQLIDEIPHEARLERYGLDFGYSNDPTAIVGVYYYNGGYIFDELLYKTGLLNNALADFLLSLPQVLVKADSAEPKSIQEIASRGVMIVGAKKGKDSVSHGIQFIQQQRISITKRSLNMIKEYRNYMWGTNIDGKIINEPIGINDHCMSAIRYALDDSIVNMVQNMRPKYGTGDYIMDNLRYIRDREQGDSYYS